MLPRVIEVHRFIGLGVHVTSGASGFVSGCRIVCGALHQDPDHPLERAAIQCSDPEATGWAQSAGLAIGLVPEIIILDSEYDDSGADVRAMLLASQHVGINGLAHAVQ